MSLQRGARSAVDTAREFAFMAAAGFEPDLRRDLGQRIRFRPSLDLSGEQRELLAAVEEAVRHAPLAAQARAWAALEALLDARPSDRQPSV